MKVTSAIVGTVLLTTALILSYLSNSSATEMMAKKDAIIMKYVNKSNNALESGDIYGAIKFAKLAIVVDPKSKSGFEAYETAIKSQYKPADSSDIYTNSTNKKEMPSHKMEKAPDMGC